MVPILDPNEFLRDAQVSPVIDVRSPGEYIQGHIPGAVNIPLFDDRERAIIGTIYTKVGSEAAIEKGLEIATPKIPFYLNSLQEVAKDHRILVHCWRGGMRSAEMAALFAREGFEPSLLKGGYKEYRRFVRAELGQPAHVMVIGGYTGSGKTEILKMLEKNGCQVIDLEGLACHKGSAFGALGQPAQPTNEQFENELYLQWSKFDLSQPVWLEDESRMVGRVTLPEPVFDKICTGWLLKIDVPKADRIRRLVEEYAQYDKKLLSEAITKISERLGRPRTLDALKAIENSEFEKVASNVLTYYDKAYDFSTFRRPGQRISRFVISQPGEQTALRLMSFIKENFDNEPRLS